MSLEEGDEEAQVQVCSSVMQLGLLCGGRCSRASATGISLDESPSSGESGDSSGEESLEEGDEQAQVCMHVCETPSLSRCDNRLTWQHLSWQPAAQARDPVMGTAIAAMSCSEGLPAEL